MSLGQLSYPEPEPEPETETETEPETELRQNDNIKEHTDMKREFQDPTGGRRLTIEHSDDDDAVTVTRADGDEVEVAGIHPV